ncbi:MAG: response regulator transcription factor [Clostridiales bacterium]|nr:response regulator transcription factor [Clostridiales bacterium]
MNRILVVDDDRDIVAALEIYLSNGGYEVIRAYNGRQAIDVLREHRVDLILMDVMMPQMDGIAATKQIRANSNIPILFLTAKSEDVDLIQGLNVGADDYITKPFKPMEVLARVRSHLRRYTQLGGRADGDRNVLQVGPIVMDDRAKQVTLDGDAVELTSTQYNILRVMMQHPGQVLSSAQIYEAVWKDPLLGSENVVAVHIRHLREKLEIDPAHPRYLKVVWGMGYKLEG